MPSAPFSHSSPTRPSICFAGLLAFGLVHAYLIWYGDLLVLYAICGFVIYPFRWRQPLTLLVRGLLALPVWTVWQMNAWQWEAVRSYFFATQFNYWGSLLVSCGWIDLFILLARHDSIRWFQARLVAVGRTAFSSYILTSVICPFVFYGHGLGLFGTVGRPDQLLVTLAVGTVSLVAAPVWLDRFQFGPLEWVWRSLTYGERQRLRRERAAVALGAP